jgi:hypothetical protein
MRAGFFRREDRAWEKIATLGLWILAPHTKQHLTIPKLLGRARLQTLPAPLAPTGAEADEAQLEAERAAVLAKALAWAEGAADEGEGHARGDGPAATDAQGGPGGRPGAGE